MPSTDLVSPPAGAAGAEAAGADAAGAAGVEAAGLLDAAGGVLAFPPPQAARDRDMAIARAIARIFFIFLTS